MDGQRIVSAAVLTGGASRRMGTDKASIVLDGITLLERAIQTLQGLSDDVFVVGDRPDYHRYGVRVVADAFPGAGTLGGIGTALRCAQHSRVVVVACDMPLLSASLLRAMVALPADQQVVIPWRPTEHARQGGGGTFETLHAIYHRDCFPYIERRIERGQFRVIGFFEEVDVRKLDELWLRAHDPTLRSFQNANTHEDLDHVRQILAEECMT